MRLSIRNQLTGEIVGVHLGAVWPPFRSDWTAGKTWSLHPLRKKPLRSLG